jgi:hypothetical protein
MPARKRRMNAETPRRGDEKSTNHFKEESGTCVGIL